MSNGHWWRRLGNEPRRKKFLWLTRSPPKPEEALHLAVLSPITSSAKHLAVEASCPTEPRWLLKLKQQPQLEARSVNLESRFERPSTSSGASRAPRARAVGVSPTEKRDIQEEGASLADRLRTILAVPLEVLLPGQDSILEWPSGLKEYQLDGVRVLLERERVLLADDMGLGKTIQAIAAIRILLVKHAIERVLLLIPASLIDQWRREIMLWAPELRMIALRGPAHERAWQWSADAHIKLVSYETFRSDFPGLAPRLPEMWDLVVLDEAQKIKNRDSETSRLVKGLRRRRSWALTGTPLENKLDDLASILEFVDHNEDGTSKTYSPSAALLERHRALQLRRKKADVLSELPPKQIVNLQLRLSRRQQDAYERAETEGVIRLRERGTEVRVEHVLALITKLKQLCNFDPASGESAKLEDVRERLKTLTEEGHRALLFSQFTDENFGVAAIAAYLEEFNPLTYTGSHSSPERDSVVMRFKRDKIHRALVLSLRAGGLGLNLQEASYVFHIDRWWNPAIERQAEDRSHRIGQTYPVTVFKYTCVGTIEERIERILSEKKQLFDILVDDVSIDLATNLNHSELFGLVGLETPSAPGVLHPMRTGLELEERCAAILEVQGWSVKRTPRVRDGGIDLICTKRDEVGIEQRIFVQCKDYARPVGVEVVRELLGVLPTDGATRAVIAAPSGLTVDAARLAKERNVTVWDEAFLQQLEGPQNEQAG